MEQINLSDILTQDAPEQMPARCPHLGVPRDPHTWAAYVSGDNVCHKTRDEVFVSFEHQAGYCLSAGHGQCPIYQAKDTWNGPLPPGVRAVDARPAVRVNVNWIIGGAAAAISLLGALLIALALELI